MIGLEQHSVASVVLLALTLSNNSEARELFVAARRCFAARCLVACVGAAAIGGPTAMAPTPKTSWLTRVQTPQPHYVGPMCPYSSAQQRKARSATGNYCAGEIDRGSAAKAAQSA